MRISPHSQRHSHTSPNTFPRTTNRPNRRPDIACPPRAITSGPMNAYERSRAARATRYPPTPAKRATATPGASQRTPAVRRQCMRRLSREPRPLTPRIHPPLNRLRCNPRGDSDSTVDNYPQRRFGEHDHAVRDHHIARRHERHPRARARIWDSLRSLPPHQIPKARTNASVVVALTALVRFMAPGKKVGTVGTWGQYSILLPVSVPTALRRSPPET